MKNQKTILIYEWQAEHERNMTKFCREKEISVTSVAVSSYAEPLGALAKISGIKKNNKKDIGPALGEEMMVFAGMNGEEIEQFLDTYQQAGIPAVQLKAILTPYNIFWNSRQLHEELRRERESLRG